MSIITQRLARAEQAMPKPLNDPVSPLMREATRIMMYMRPDYTNDGPPFAPEKNPVFGVVGFKTPRLALKPFSPFFSFSAFLALAIKPFSPFPL